MQHIDIFLNTDRPQLLQYASLTELPTEELGPDITATLSKSFNVHSSNGIACAASARIWENILQTHRIPYLLIRVADMRMSLGSKSTALTLYEEVQAMLNDEHLGKWIASLRTAIAIESEQQLKRYRYGPDFLPSQRWRPTAQDPYPYCKLQRAQLSALRDQWKHMNSAEDVFDRFLNLHCVETNLMEGAFEFSQKDAHDLIKSGFNNQDRTFKIIGGEVTNFSDTLGILGDTHKALKEISTFAVSDSPKLTMEVVCRLHARLMQTSQVLYIDSGSRRKISYINSGVTRQQSRVNVTASAVPTTPTNRRVKVQFCPYDEVDQELRLFCERFNALVGDTERDPFASAAWINYVFATVHPFEDGNGRLSRILASVPLLRSGLPPLCIQALYKPLYIAHNNSIRADRNGDYQMAMEMMYKATKASMDLFCTVIGETQ